MRGARRDTCVHRASNRLAANGQDDLLKWDGSRWGIFANGSCYYAHDEDVQNTLVEKGGHLRPATAEEVSNTAWKPVRNQQEFTYAGAKRAWVGHKLRGEKGGWGRVERDLEKERREDEETKKENDLPGGVDDADSGAEGNDGEAPSKAKEGSKGA